jgi:hypothetical protein
MRITKPRNYQYMTDKEKQAWADRMTIEIKKAREDFHKMVDKKVKELEEKEKQV